MGIPPTVPPLATAKAPSRPGYQQHNASPANQHSRCPQSPRHVTANALPGPVAMGFPQNEVGAPCLSRGKLDFSPAEQRGRLESASAAGLTLNLKRRNSNLRLALPAPDRGYFQGFLVLVGGEEAGHAVVGRGARRRGAQSGTEDANGNFEDSGSCGAPALKRFVNGEAFCGALKRSSPPHECGGSHPTSTALPHRANSPALKRFIHGEGFFAER